MCPQDKVNDTADRDAIVKFCKDFHSKDDRLVETATALLTKIGTTPEAETKPDTRH
ncbi:MAG: hypothetical protein AAF412_00965 [Pseudomonadota bacterium]